MSTSEMPRSGRIKNLGRAGLGARQKDLPAPDLHYLGDPNLYRIPLHQCP